MSRSALRRHWTTSRGVSFHPSGHSRPLPVSSSLPGAAPLRPPVRSIRRLRGPRCSRLLPGLAFPLHSFKYIYRLFLRPFFSHSCRKKEGAGRGGGREKYCLNSQRGASGAPCAWHLCSLCPEQRSRTGARGRRGRRASVGSHNKVTKTAARARPRRAALSKGGRGAAARRYYEAG